ncbi:Non-structural maintenance of chromosomes element 3-like protein [Acropora cervicornis]|uniref:Non-structural maintenance of chromosomes element 3-like protein n=1 Tax=Acropora cervicornis TaxID=6130 RepID=A0AAD9UST0_ACRCE|nr:Non-structural maintenance of chromosomes element 3-like protein [Acropora cervicornis]
MRRMDNPGVLSGACVAVEDGHCSQSQRSGRSNQRIDEEEEEAETESTQIGRSQKSHKELSKDELNRKKSFQNDEDWLLCYRDSALGGRVIQDITKNVLKEHAKAFNQVFERAKKDLQKVFGIDVVEIEVGKSKGYILINESIAQGNLIDWGDDLPKIGLLLVVLSLIITSDHDFVITECKYAQLWHTLKRFGIEPKAEHKVFGDADKLISQEFVRQCYLDRKKVVGGDETAYEYRWGQRAEKELSKKKLGLFISEIYGTELESWSSQMRDLFSDEEQPVDVAE